MEACTQRVQMSQDAGSALTGRAWVFLEPNLILLSNVIIKFNYLFDKVSTACCFYVIAQ